MRHTSYGGRCSAHRDATLSGGARGKPSGPAVLPVASLTVVGRGLSGLAGKTFHHCKAPYIQTMATIPAQ